MVDGTTPSLGILSIVKIIPMLFAWVFIIFIAISTLSHGYNQAKETNNPVTFFISIGKAIIKPIVSSDKMIYDCVDVFKNSESISKTQLAILWIKIVGSLNAICFIFKNVIYSFVNGSFKDSPALVNFGFSVGIMVMFVTLYNSVSASELMFGGEGLFNLFINFDVVFSPIIDIGERLMGITNKIPLPNIE